MADTFPVQLYPGGNMEECGKLLSPGACATINTIQGKFTALGALLDDMRARFVAYQAQVQARDTELQGVRDNLGAVEGNLKAATDAERAWEEERTRLDAEIAAAAQRGEQASQELKNARDAAAAQELAAEEARALLLQERDALQAEKMKLEQSQNTTMQELKTLRDKMAEVLANINTNMGALEGKGGEILTTYRVNIPAMEGQAGA